MGVLTDSRIRRDRQEARRRDLDTVARWMVQEVLRDPLLNADARVQLTQMMRKRGLLTPQEICYATEQFDHMEDKHAA